MPKLPTIEEEYVLSNLDTLKILSDPLRMQILEQISLINERGQAAAVKQLADALSMPPTKLYYHVNLLEEHGLIRVVETRLISGILEKRYQVRARRIRAELDLETSEAGTDEEKLELVLESVSGILNKTLASLKESYRYLLRTKDRQQLERALEQSEIDIQQTTLELDKNEAREFRIKLRDLIESYVSIEPADVEHMYKLTIVFHPAYHLDLSAKGHDHGDTIL